MDAKSWIIIISGVGFGSYLIRSAPFLIGKKVKFPPLFLDWLIFISIGIMAGFISKTLFVKGSQLYFGDFFVQASALAIAVLFQLKFQKILLSVFLAVLAAMIIKVLMG